MAVVGDQATQVHADQRARRQVQFLHSLHDRILLVLVEDDVSVEIARHLVILIASLLADLQARQANLRQTLLRISGAMQVLEEELARAAQPAEDTLE